MKSTTSAIRELPALLKSLTPILNSGVFVFCSVPSATNLAGVAPIATFREAEGLTLVLEESAGVKANFTPLFKAAWITLTVHSDLQAVGLTAAVAAALSEAGISCNVMAAAFHDHIFVPVESARAAMEVLQALQKNALISAA